MHMTVECAGSLTLQERVPPQPDTEEIQEGHAAHYVALMAARGQPLAVGTKFTHGAREWTVDLDMFDGAAMYAAAVGPAHLLGHQFEQAIPIRRVHPECWGTPDHWRCTLDAENRPILLEVDDYKFGHRFVDAFENWQLAAYAIGVLDQLGISPGDDALTVVLRIIQPRAYHPDGPVKEWRTTPFKLGEFLKRMRDAVASALGPNPQCNTGSHCLDCHARAACATLRNSVAAVVDFSSTAELQPLDTHAAAVELRIIDEAAERLKARRTAVHAQVENAARKGERVPGYHMEPKESRLTYLPNVTVSEVDAMIRMVAPSVKALKEPELITPTQLANALKRAGVDESVIREYAERPTPGLKLAPDGNKARKIFAHNKQ